MNQQDLLTELATLRLKVAQLEESETRYRMVFETADEAVIVVQDGLIRWANPKATEISGYSEQELLSAPFASIIHPDDRERVMHYHMQRMRGDLDKKGYQFRILTKNGTVKWVQHNTSTISWEGRPAGLGLSTDITGQKQLKENLQRAHDELEKRVEERTTALREVNEKLRLEIAERARAEEALRLEREQLLAIFDSTDEVISVIDPETYEILYANKFVRDRQGKEVIGGVCYKDLHGLAKPCDHCTKHIVGKLEGKPYRWDYHNPTTNRDYLATDRIIKWTDGRAAKFHLGIDVTERKNAEEALRDSERRFRELAELLPEPVVQFDLAGIVTFANQRAFEAFGSSREDLSRGISVLDVVVPEDRDRVRENMRRLLNREDYGLEEYTCVRKDSTKFPAFIHSRPILSNDALVGITSIILDLSERKRTEAALQASEAKYRLLIENAPVGILSIDRDGHIVNVNSKLLEIMSSSSSDETKVINMLEFAPLKDAGISDVFLTCMAHATVQASELPYTSKWGRTSYLRLIVTPLFDESGGVNGCQAVVEDVTDRKKAENALRETRRMLESILAAVPVGIALHRNRQVQWANEAWAKLFGFAGPNECVGRNTRVMHQSDAEYEHAREALYEDLAAEGVREIDAQLRRQDGSVFDAIIRTRALDPSDLAKGVIGAIADVSERKRAEEALRESEEKYRLFVETANELVFVAQDGMIRFANRRVMGLMGYSEAELLSRPMIELIHPDDRETVIQHHLLRLRGDDAPYSYSFRIIDKHGNTKWLDLNSALITWEGSPAALCFATDITDRKLAEDALRESQEKYRMIFERAPLGILHFDQRGVILDFNDKFAEMIGAPREKLVGFNMPESQQDERMREAVLEAVDGKTSYYEGDYLSVTGGKLTPMRAFYGPVLSEDGRFLGAVGIFEDVTERKRTEEALQISQERLELALKGADLGLWDWDLKTNRVVWNEQALKMLGYMNAEVERNFHWSKDLFHPEDWPKVSEALTAHVDGGSPSYESEYRLQSKSGEWKWILARGKIVEFDTDGRPSRMTGTILDITKRKKAEQEREQLRNQLAQAQKMESIGTLTGGIAHDFNNLLTIMNGFTELVLSEKTEDDPSYSDLQKILETGRKGADLVKLLLALSKKGESNPQPLDLNHTVENSSKLMERTFPKMIEIETILAKDLSMVNADAVQVEQVLMNVCINAKEAMPNGGKLTIETKNVTVDEAECRLQVAAKPGPHVLVEVADTGTGMDAETLARLFDPFFTTKGWDFKKGTGLSLPVAKGIVEQHGGWITCKSEPGKGTTLGIYFPAIVEVPVAEMSVTPTENVPCSEKILLVDDEDYVRDLGKRILERSGCTVLTASNGREALEIYAREQPNIGLIVLDLIMPHMGGEKFLEELLKINPQARVIISTGHSLDPKERDRLGAHAKGFVSKPYQMEQFMEVVRGVLAAS